jgi:hypothetical protein
MIQYVQKSAKLGGSTNSTFLALIPKDANPSTFSRFRPISLCNVSYKLITKVIANRIKPLLHQLISPNQSGFVEKRQMIDNIILVQEAIHSSRGRGDQGMIIKIDMANTFDRVRHSFLFAVLKKFGFSSELIAWVTACISMPWIAPLVNGRPTSFFKSSRGLRQGCPLSPLLYIIMVETLGRQLEKDRTSKAIPGIKITRGTKRINHSQFVDDTLLIGGASIIMAKRFKTALENFTQASGALINNAKSNVYAWNTPIRTARLIASIFCFPLIEKWQSFRYLGIPICLKSLPNSAWNQILDKLKNKLEHWGAFWLNLAGHTVLIKSVLSALPIFQFSSLLAPQNVKSSISSLLRRFLWEGGKTDKKKYHLIKWDIVKHPKENGGLGIRDPGLSNLAMGAKILWNLVSRKNDWWKRILQKKYLVGSRLRCLDQRHSLDSGSPIGKLLSASIPLIQSQLTWIPGNGRKILIGADNIMGKQPL